MKKLFLLIITLSLLLSSCVVSEKLTLNSGKSGESLSDITIDPFFISVLNDLSSISDKSGSDIMDDAMVSFASSLSSSSSSKNVSLITTADEKRYVISFTYSSLEKLLTDLNNGKSNTLLKITDNSLYFNLDINNYGELKSVIPLLSDKNFEVYGPEYSYGMSEEEYIEMITFLLSGESEDALKSSYVSVDITLPGKIKSVKGAEIKGEREVVFTFPVIDFLLLNEPLSFSIEWN